MIVLKKSLIQWLIIATSVLLVACGGSDEDEVEQVVLNVTLAQGSSWQQDLDLGNFAAIISAPQHGVLSLNNNRVSYVPYQSYRGTDQARIEGSRNVYAIQFTVTAVNQPPVLQNTEIEVVASREITGHLVVYDQDNDPIQFELVAPPESGEFELYQDGRFRYLLDDLILPNATFTVSLSDGVNQPVIEDVLLLPAYTTNEEKAAYYYFSNASHLSVSERRLAEIQSSLDTETAYQSVALGYVGASLDDEVQRILTNYIQSQAEQANTLKAIANAYDERNETDKAAQFRQLALETHVQMVLDNGIENMVNADGRYYLSLLRDALAAQDDVLANRIIHQVNLYLDALAGGVYKNAIGFIAQTARTNSVELASAYLKSGDQELLEQAIENLDIMARAAASAGYQEFSNRPTHYRLAPLYYVWAAEQYFYIGEIDKAKHALAETLAYYGPVDYDPNLVLPAKNFAENTVDQYRAPLTEASALFSALYPNSANYPQQILATYGTAREQESAERSVQAMTYFLRVLNDGTGTNAIEQVLADMATAYGSNPRTFVSEIIESSEQFPKLAALLWRYNRQDEARVAYQYALDIVASDAYAQQNANTPAFYTGNNGCFRIVNRILGNNDVAFAQQAANQCAGLLNHVSSNHFAHLSNVIKMQHAVGQSNLAEQLFMQASAVIETELTTEISQANAWFDLAKLSANAKRYHEVLAYVEQGFAQLNEAPRVTVNEFKGVLTALDKIMSISTSTTVYEPAVAVLTELRSHAYNDSQYQTLLTDIQAPLNTLLTTLDSELKQRPVVEQGDLIFDLVEALAQVRHYTLAEQTIQALDIGTAEKFASLAVLSELQALQDDFPASPIATVDTDQDGKANFFAIAATPGQLANTDIELDDDADGDGVADEEDPQPLGSL